MCGLLPFRFRGSSTEVGWQDPYLQISLEVDYEKDAELVLYGLKLLSNFKPEFRTPAGERRSDQLDLVLLHNGSTWQVVARMHRGAAHTLISLRVAQQRLGSWTARIS